MTSDRFRVNIFIFACITAFCPFAVGAARVFNVSIIVLRYFQKFTGSIKCNLIFSEP